MKPDAIVVGAGPAGVSAALWARSLGLEPLVLERAEVGGQLLHVHFTPANLPAGADGDGHALARRLETQLGASAIALRRPVAVAAFDPTGPAVKTADGERLEALALVVATGVRRRQLGVPGERELEGRGVSYSATQDRARFAGKDVVVVGGGDAAFENALLLSDVGCRVRVVVRGRPRAREEFRARVAGDPRIEILENTRVRAIEGDDRVRRVAVASATGSDDLAAEGVVIKIGVIPNTEWCRGGAIALDEDGYVRVDEELRTSHPRVWAAGDVTRPLVFGIAVAAGQGAPAAAALRAQIRG